MKPYVICHMISSIDGSLSPSKFTTSPDGTRSEWSALYTEVQETLKQDAWLVGRTTMGEMSKGEPHPVASGPPPERPVHKAATDRQSFAVGLDTSGKLHFASSVIEDAHVVVLLGSAVSDAHLRELIADGVSYVVSATPEIDLLAMLETLGDEFGVRRLALEGGASINGSFFAAGLVDELSILVAPALDARVGAPGIIEHGEDGLAGKVQLKLIAADTLKSGVAHLRYAVSAG
jgi:riboflavin biosynthesis pyrimidine reductase